MLNSEQLFKRVDPLAIENTPQGEIAEIKPPQNEKRQIYANIDDDPTYQFLQKDINKRISRDSQVESARRSGRGFSETWNRVAIREDMNGMDRFATNHPEKAQAYAKRWNEFVNQNPQVEGMNNAQWEKWCESNPGSFFKMNDYRRIARAVNRAERRSEEERHRQSVKETERQLEIKSDSLGLPVSEEERKKLENKKLQHTEKQTKRVIGNIKDSTPQELSNADDAELRKRQENLRELPFISSGYIRNLIDIEGDNEGFEFVDTHKIVGTVSPAFEDWSTEYESRKGRTVDIAKSLLNPTEESVENIFHLKKENERIKLKKISGPAGELFFVVDGTHRIAGCKLSQVHETPAQVENVSNPKEIFTTDETLAGQWKRRIEKGLIDGAVKHDEKGNYKLEIEGQILPWMHLPDEKMIKFCQFYESQYPNSLDKLKIPKQALLDIVGYNYFMAGRYDEYVQMKKKEKAV